MARSKTMKSATAEGSRIEMLKALAARLASAIDGMDDERSLASLARQYRECIREIDELEGGVDDDDQINIIIERNAARKR